MRKKRHTVHAALPNIACIWLVITRVNTSQTRHVLMFRDKQVFSAMPQKDDWCNEMHIFPLESLHCFADSLVKLFLLHRVSWFIYIKVHRTRDWFVQIKTQDELVQCKKRVVHRAHLSCGVCDVCQPPDESVTRTTRFARSCPVTPFCCICAVRIWYMSSEEEWIGVRGTAIGLRAKKIIEAFQIKRHAPHCISQFRICFQRKNLLISTEHRHKHMCR